MTAHNNLSPEKYDGLARSYIESGMVAQNEASYNFEGADPELDFAWASEWQRIADLLRERLPGSDTVEVREHEAATETLKSGVIGNIKAYTQDAPLELGEERLSIFRKTRSATKTHTSSSPTRKVSVSNIAQSTFFLGNVWDESRKFRVTEYDGTKEDFHGYEPYALVATHFDVNPTTAELTVTQETSPSVSPEHQVIFPSLGIEEKTSDEQWARLAAVIALIED